MSKPLIDRCSYDHPEHFDDDIRSYKTSDRYIPTPLENLLFELAGHHCSICRAPFLEIHHIDELSEGGQSEYDNLIVLCPNCHTRVHAENIPSKTELHHYKLKHEIAYELPIISRLSDNEKNFIKHVATLKPEDQIAFSKREYLEIEEKDQETAVRIFKKSLGFHELERSGMVFLERGFVVTMADLNHVSVEILVRLTSKGCKWICYLISSGKLSNI